MRFHTVVITTGLSAIVGKNNLFVLTKEEWDWLKEADLDTNMPFDEVAHEPVVRRIVENKEPYVRRLPDHDPTKVSAEYSLVHKLQKEGRLDRRPRLILISTNTIGGEIVSRLLEQAFKLQGIDEVKISRVERWKIDDRDAMRFGVADFVSKLARALQEGEPSTTAFSPVGGYKVMTAYSYLVGSYLGYPSLYLHEDGQVVLTIPPLPIAINREELLKHQGFLSRMYLQDVVSIEDLGPDEKTFVESHLVFFEREDDLVALSAFGRLVVEKEGLVRLDVRLSPQVADKLRADKTVREAFCAQVTTLVQKLIHGHYDDSTHHERSFKNLDRLRLQYHLYKGSSNGQVLLRLAYRYDPEMHRLYARHLWTDHDAYEREAAQGIGLYGGGPKEEAQYASYEDHFGASCGM